MSYQEKPNYGGEDLTPITDPAEQKKQIDAMRDRVAALAGKAEALKAAGLFPCPFCGGPAKLHELVQMVGRPKEWTVCCQNCTTCFPTSRLKPDAAIDAWNRRPALVGPGKGDEGGGRDAFYEGFRAAVDRGDKETRNGWLDAWNESRLKKGEPTLCGCGRKLGDGSLLSATARESAHGRYHTAEARVCYFCATQVINRLVMTDSLRLLLLGGEAEPPATPASPRAEQSFQGHTDFQRQQFRKAEPKGYTDVTGRAQDTQEGR